MNRRPVIGLTTRLELETDRFYLGRHYSEALENFGAIPMHFALIANCEYIKSALQCLDGVLLPGSDTDVNPHLYGEEPHVRLKKVINVKDETERLVLEEVEKLKMPILAICYGCQALNVMRGGNLYQDIETQVEGSLKHEQGIPLDRNSHSITIQDGSLLKRLITKIDGNEDSFSVNSHHHQSIKEIGRNLRATAWAKDSVIECIEDTRDDRFILGVQWHPELSWRTDLLSNKIFERFTDECRKFADRKNKYSEE